MSKTAMHPISALLVDNDREFVRFLQEKLEDQGCTVTTGFDGGTGLRQATGHAFDIVLLATELSVISGFEVAKRLRMLRVATPILLLARQAIPADAIRALNAGAHDYLPKSLGFECLYAYICARAHPDAAQNLKHLRFADLLLDAERHQVLRAGQRFPLTRTEFVILKCLMHAAGRIVPRSQIIESVWGDRDISENNLDVFIRFLRAKVDRPGLPRLLHTERGVGYSIREAAY